MPTKKIYPIKHPLIQHKLNLIRSVDIGIKSLRELINELSALLVYEAAREVVPTYHKKIQTWAGALEVEKIHPHKIILVPILRAGVSMIEGALQVFPLAKINFSGIFRDEATAQPKVYYHNIIQPAPDDIAFIIDPMLATGGSMAETIQLLRKAGYQKLVGVCLIAAPEGIEKVFAADPEFILYLGSVDSHLNEKKYILPGLGDAGDRVFETG